MPETSSALIRERYERVLARIEAAAVGSDHDPKTIRLVVVSKSQPLAVVQAALEAGITRLGENYAEEAVGKIAALPQSGVEWHMIGHVQSRKADLISTHFSMLHSLDGLKLAARLDRFCRERDRILPVLLEFNVSGEESKFGLPAWDESRWPDLDPELEQILALPYLKVSGLMTMPPFFVDPERSRPYFKRLRRLQEYLAGRFSQTQWADLSMGTSVDYETAIQEGATYVRVGQAILGPRST
jgi:PLP dependent protein